MAESIERSPLAALEPAMAPAGGVGVTLRAADPVAQVGVRLDQRADAAAASRVTAVLGVELPTMPNDVKAGVRHRVLWLGPDEFLVVGPPGTGVELAAALETAAGDAFVTAVDLSVNRAVLHLAGDDAVDVLAHGCSLDLNDRAFPPGGCAQTLVARVQAIVERIEPEVFLLYVRPSFTPYLVAWLVDAMDPYRSPRSRG